MRTPFWVIAVSLGVLCGLEVAPATVAQVTVTLFAGLLALTAARSVYRKHRSEAKERLRAFREVTIQTEAERLQHNENGGCREGAV